MISVVIATYNGEKYFAEQLRSVLSQTVLPDEILIGDDASTDRTVEIAEGVLSEFCSGKHGRELAEEKTSGGKVPSVPIRWEIIRRERNVGNRENFFDLLSRAKGDLVFLCDQDDIWLDRKVEKMQDVFSHNPKVMALSTTFTVIDGENQVCKTGRGNGALKSVSHADFLRYPAYLGMTMCVRREVIEKTLDSFKEHKAMHDWALNYVASSMGGMYLLEKPLTLYRRHGGNVSAMLEQEVKEKRLEKRVALVQELLDNFSEAGEEANREWIGFEKKRAELLKTGKIGPLLQYELAHYKYTKLRPMLGDVYSLL